jgi:flagellar P-ring protein precursor FlgI
MRFRFTTLVLFLACSVCTVHGARIKDIVEIQGIRGNSLMGTGLVVGLNATGDSAAPSRQMLSSLLQREGGMTFSPTTLGSGSIAIVIVTAELGPWDRAGSRIDINVSAVGDASSLQGGVLLATELKGLDGEVYAVARAASISTASWTVEGKTGSKVAKNHPTVGRIPDGAYVEKEELSSFIEIIGEQRYISLNLRNGDFTTAQRIRESVEAVYPASAFVVDAGTIRIKMPADVSMLDAAAFVDNITSLNVEVDMPAIVVINERTGTIVVGGHVSISETAVAQGSLVVKIKEQQFVSQPSAPFTDGATTEVVQDTALSIEEGEGSLIPVPRVVTVTELANALNAIGATPRDMIAIFNALKVAGALQAKIEMM